jgi:hypothetical protein
MRPSISLLIIGAWAVAALAQAQTAATSPPVGSRQAAAGAAAARPAAPPGGHSKAARISAGPAARESPAAPVAAAAPGRPPAGKGGGKADGVLALGATDITGNKELPKVMVIVPWKSPTDADGIAKPGDSLLDEVLQPVDRGVFQRRIRYYGQLEAAPGPSPPGHVAPVGDSH